MTNTPGPTTQNKTAQAQQSRSREAAAAPPAGAYGEYADPGMALVLGSSLDKQARYLGSPGVPSAQRQRMARSIAARHGNQHIQRLLTHDAAQPQANLPAGSLQPLIKQPATPVAARQDQQPEKKKIDSLDPSQFTVEVQQAPTIEGGYTTERKGQGIDSILKITAPKITMKANVTLKADAYEFNEGDGVRVGPVQVLTSSVRTGVYEKDGKEVARYSDTLNNVRDARPLAEKAGGPATSKAETPFYDVPNGVSNSLWTAPVNFIDMPAAGFPIHFGGGTLTRIEGADNFNTSIGIKSVKTGQIILVNPFGWRANWSMSLDPNLGVAVDDQGKSTAKGLEIWEETVGQVIETDAYAAEIAKDKQPILTFLTVEAAMTESAQSLWLALAAARAADPASVVNIQAALAAKNPTFRLAVRVNTAVTGRHWSLSKSDKVTAWANAGKQSPDKGPLDIQEGKTGIFEFSLNEIADIASITGSSTLTVWAGGGDPENPVLGDSIDLPYPFLSGGDITVMASDRTTGTYSLSVSMP